MRRRVAALLFLALPACLPPGGPSLGPGRPRAFKARERRELPGGPAARGRPGDIVIENGVAAFVVDTAAQGFAESAGNLVDAALLDHPDLLNQVFTSFADEFPRQAHYRAVEIADDGRSGMAVVRATGQDSKDARILVTTTYRLAAGEAALRITTTLENRGPETVAHFALGDAIQWGRAEHFEPGAGVELGGRRTRAPWIAGVGEGTSYLYYPLQGALSTVHGHSWSDTDVAAPDLPPGERVTYERVLAVGTGDVASVLGPMLAARRLPAGTVEGEVVEEGGGRADDATVRVDREGAPFATAAAARGRFRIALPPGDYLFSASGPGRRAEPPSTARVTAGGESRLSLRVSAQSRLRLEVRDRAGAFLPAKATFEGLGGTADPDLGPGFRADGARNVILMGPAPLDRPFPPGHYRATFSRGPLYDAVTRELTIPAGASASASVKLERTVSLPGWVSADFHQHAAPASPDSATSLDDRALANAAEGVDVLVGTDHNFITDYRPVVERLGLAAFVHAVAGDEITWETQGHWGCWPMTPRPEALLGGAPAITGDTTVAGLYRQCRDAHPDNVLTVNHPRSGPENGYFDSHGFDSATGASVRPLDLAVDAIEVFNGKSLEQAERVLADWMAMLSRGLTPAAVGSSDTHGIYDAEAGQARTLVRVGTDDPRKVTDGALVDAVKRRREAVVTNGPVLFLSVNGAPIGSRLQGKQARVAVRLEQANWVEADRVEVFTGRIAPGEAALPPIRVKRWDLAEGSRRFEGELTLTVDRAVWIVAVARGKRSLAPVVAAGKVKVTPLAFTNPVWIGP